MDNYVGPKIIRTHRRSIAIKVLPDASVVVHAPRLLPKFLIDKFIHEQKDWIIKQQEKMKKSKKSERKYQDGEVFLFLGKKYTLKFGNYGSFKIQGDNFLMPSFMAFRAEKEITSFYIKQAKSLITKQTEDFAKKMNTSFKSIMFSDTRSKWGSCTHDNRLQFSWRLVMAPPLVLNYVVIHELAHTKQKNHSRSFWSIVRLFTPSYKQQIKWLKEHGNSLV